MQLNMKKLIIPLLLLSLVACNRGLYRSKVNPGYKPLSAFKVDSINIVGSDTADFLNYNFGHHKDKYIGKPFKVLVNDLRPNIYQVTTRQPPYDRGFFNEINIYFHDIGYDKKGVYYDLVVVFQDKLLTKEYRIIENNYDYTWNKTKYDYFKNLIIKDIVVSDSRTWNKASKNVLK